MATTPTLPPDRSGLPLHAARGHGDAVDPLCAEWAALHDAADLVAELAGLAPEPSNTSTAAFAAKVGAAGGWRDQLARQGVDDLAAIMKHGIAALLAIRARGAETGPAALALWQEFRAARAALLGLLPPPDCVGTA